MAAATQSSSEEHAEQKKLEKEMSDLRSVKQVLSERAKPVNDELERVAQREREVVGRLHRLATQSRDGTRQQTTYQCVFQLGSEQDRGNKWKRALQRSRTNPAAAQAQTKPQQKLENGATAAAKPEAVSQTAAEGELQKQLKLTTKLLNKTREELYKTRQRLSDVQERLTVAEQVTAATQQRVLQETDNSDELQLELTSQHAGWRLDVYSLLLLMMNEFSHSITYRFRLFWFFRLVQIPSQWHSKPEFHPFLSYVRISPDVLDRINTLIV